MKTKHIIILGVIFILLAGALLVKKAFVKPELEVEEYKNIEISLDASAIYAIEAKKTGEDAFRIEKKEGVWRIPSKWGIKADSKKVDGLIRAISGLEGELRSSSEKLFSDYGISDNEALSVVIYDESNKPLHRFFVGSKKPQYGSSFLRMDDSADVYIVTTDISELFGMFGDLKTATINADRWLDLSILDIDGEKIDSLLVVRSNADGEIVATDLKKELDEEKGLKRWIAAEENLVFDIDAKKIKNFLQEINNLKAVKALSPEGEEYGFESPYAKIFFGVEGSQAEVIIGAEEKEDSEDRYIKNPEGQVYLARRYAIEKLNVDVSKFFIDNPLRVSEDNISSITIISQDENIELNKVLIKKNAEYMDKLKKFSVEKILFDKAPVKVPVKYSLEIKKEDGQAIALDVQKEDDGTFIAQLRGRPAVFKIEKTIFNGIFTGLDKLDLTVEPTTSTAP